MPDVAEDLVDVASNIELTKHFLNLARELEVLEPKTPADIYKAHLEPGRASLFGGLRFFLSFSETYGGVFFFFQPRNSSRRRRTWRRPSSTRS